MIRIKYRLFLLALITGCSLATWALAQETYVNFPPERIEVYFRTNSAVIDPPFRGLLTQHGRFLAANPERIIRIEGHTDLRGSREYNLALGERRAIAVKNILLKNGSREEQLSAVSFGEEIRIEHPRSTRAMKRNRRVVIVYE